MTTVFVTCTVADAEHWPALAARADDLGAVAAVLQGDGPALAQTLSELALAGTTEITLVAVTFAAGGAPASWVGRVARWWLSQTDMVPTLRFLPTPWQGLPAELPEPGSGSVLRASPGTLSNPEWDEPPPVHTHLLVCRGPRCAAKGAADTMAALIAQLRGRGLLDAAVLVTQTGCLYPCNKAPVVAIQPDMDWLGPVHADDAATVVDRIQRRRPPAGQRPAG